MVTYLDFFEVLVKLGACNDSILVNIDHGKLLHELTLHAILQTRLLDSLIDRIGVRKARANVLVNRMRRIGRCGSGWKKDVDIRHYFTSTI